MMLLANPDAPRKLTRDPVVNHNLEQAAGFTASVQPVRLPLSHPLASVNDATNAVTYTTDLLGDVTLVGPGAGRIETGFSLLADLLSIHRRRG